MNSLLLVTCLIIAGADEDKLLKQLDIDFQEMMKKEKNPAPLREAARLLETSEPWPSYSTALAILRKTRSKAAVPLLLKAMTQHNGCGNDHIIIPEYVETLVILTGKNIGDRDHYAGREGVGRDAVAKLVETWWQPEKDKITTDLDKMSKEQLSLIVDRLIKKVEGGQYRHIGREIDSARYVSFELHGILHPDIMGRKNWSAEDLHPTMLPFLLVPAGYVATDKDEQRPAERDTNRIVYSAIPMLAVLRKDGELPNLDKIAFDQRQNSAVRLTCLWALYVAGEDIKTQSVFAILKDEKKLDRRLAAILALQHCRDAEAATPKLLELLDDNNREVRTAAILALQSNTPKEALPKLKKILEDMDPPEAIRTTLAIVAAMKTDEAGTVLAGFLEKALKDGKKSRYISEGLRAMETVTGQDWIEAGAHNDGYYREKAKVALDWWKKRKEQSK